VNILVMDTEVYSNTGGQKSKATPLGAVAKFAAAGKPIGKKDLGMMAMGYKNVYVASVAMGANDAQTVRAFMEAEAYPGPSIIIAYSHCIAHGINMSKGLEQQRKAVETGYWTLYRYNPQLAGSTENPLKLDSKPPKGHVRDYAMNETRFKMLTKIDPKMAEYYVETANTAARDKYSFYQELANISYNDENVEA
jgi:pyruvate-ferredoxin/flavodoxin oxidoreductase